MAKKAAAIAGGQDGPPNVSGSADAVLSMTGSNTPPPTPGDAKKSSEKLNWLQAIQDGNDKVAKQLIEMEVGSIVQRAALQKYDVIFLFDDVNTISYYHADRLYASASACRDGDKDILLILHSSGGSIEPAYLASKTLKRMCGKKFSVVVPRRAKSAATLLCLGADEIHIGMMSQLGPIDPQIGGLPALALTNAFDFIVERATRYSGASNMLAMYIGEQVPIRHLGYFQRVGESAVQYAERLLAGKVLAPDKSGPKIADHLVNYYKDHGFVIDFDEAQGLLGDDIVKHETPEYRLGDELYRYLDLVALFLSIYGGKRCSYVGAINDGFEIAPAPPKKDAA